MTATLATNTDPIDAFINAIRDIGPLIRAHAGQAERDRRLSAEVRAALAGLGCYRMLLPQTLGGLEVDPVTCARVVEEVAAADSAAGWSLQAGNSGAWWASRLPAKGAAEMFSSNPSALVAAAFHPPQQAVKAPGGYRVSGRGPLASNIHDATWLLVTALVDDATSRRPAGAPPQVIGIFLRAHEVEVIDTWDPLGMRGTDSNDVVMRDVFVPETRTFPLVPEFTPGPAFGGPLYRFPGIGQVQLLLPPVLLAIARAALNELRTLAERKTPLGSMRPLRERPAVQDLLGRSEAELRAARALFYDTVRDAWERTLAGEVATLERRADLLLAGVHAAHAAARVVDNMHRLGGTSGIYKRSPLERHFRDAQTLRHHGFMSESKYETVGQVYLGVPPEFGMVAF